MPGNALPSAASQPPMLCGMPLLKRTLSASTQPPSAAKGVSSLVMPGLKLRAVSGILYPRVNDSVDHAAGRDVLGVARAGVDVVHEHSRARRGRARQGDG